MTPEEHFTIIHNLQKTFMENLVRLEAMQLRNEEQIAKQAEETAKHAERIAKNEEQIAQNSAGIRDLIVVSRSVLTSIQEMRAEAAAQREALDEKFRATDQRLNSLIEIVDDIIRRDKRDKDDRS